MQFFSIMCDNFYEGCQKLGRFSRNDFSENDHTQFFFSLKKTTEGNQIF